MSNRFSRQKKIGWWNQQKIKGINALVVGCGGIGCYTALQLAFIGVRKIILVDSDSVEESNLNRQFFYQEDIAKNKAIALKDKLSRINPDLKMETFDSEIQKIDKKKYAEIEVVFDCVDNIETREYLQELCKKDKIIFMHAGCSDVIGEVHAYVPGKTKEMRPYPEKMKQVEQARQRCVDFDASICTTNMITAATQVDRFLDILLRKKYDKPSVTYIRGEGMYYGC